MDAYQPIAAHGTHTGLSTSLARLVDVVLDPPRAFRDAALRPTWAIAFLGVVLLRFGSVLAFYNPDTTPAKLLAGVLFQLVLIFPLVAAMSTLLWVTATIWRAHLSWPSAWCVTTHVTFAHTLLTIAIASVAGALLPESVDVDLRHPPFTNPGVLVSAAAWPALHALAAKADVRSLYATVLVCIGVRAASAAGRWTTIGIVTTCFAVTVLAAVGPALIR
jgi:hypothetical protein